MLVGAVGFRVERDVLGVFDPGLVPAFEDQVELAEGHGVQEPLNFGTNGFGFRHPASFVIDRSIIKPAGVGRQARAENAAGGLAGETGLIS